MERGDNGKFIKSALRTGEDASGTGENAYEEPVELLATPVAATPMPALPPGAGTTGAEDAPIKNDDSADGRAHTTLKHARFFLFCVDYIKCQVKCVVLNSRRGFSNTQ